MCITTGFDGWAGVAVKTNITKNDQITLLFRLSHFVIYFIFSLPGYPSTGHTKHLNTFEILFFVDRFCEIFSIFFLYYIPFNGQDLVPSKRFTVIFTVTVKAISFYFRNRGKILFLSLDVFKRKKCTFLLLHCCGFFVAFFVFSELCQFPEKFQYYFVR